MQSTQSKQNTLNVGCRARLLLALFGVGLAFLLILLLEVALRFSPLSLQEEDPYLGFSPTDSLFQREGDYYVTRSSKLPYFNQQRFTIKKPAFTKRIFVLGGSSVFGRPYDHRTSFVNFLGLILNDGDPGTTYEVINVGGISYASYRLKIIMAELVNYDPDIFIVYTGHNEFLEERTYPELVSAHPFVVGIQSQLSKLRLGQLVRSAFAGASSKTQMASEVTARLDVWNGLDRFERDVQLEAGVVEHFTYNLNTMVDMAESSGVPLFFVSPAANLVNFSPFKSQHSEGLSVQQVRSCDELLNQALNTTDTHQSLLLLRDLVQKDDAYAAYHYFLAQTLRISNDYDNALLHYQKALDLDVCPLRAKSALINSMQQVATNRKIPLLPLPELLLKEAMEAGAVAPGNDLFLDHVHPRPILHFRIARLLANMLLENKQVEGELPSAARLDEIYARVEANLDSGYHGMRDLNLAKVLGWAGKYAEATQAIARAQLALPDNPDVFFNSGVLAEKQGESDIALAAYEQTLALADDYMLAWLNRGRVLQSIGSDADALISLDHAAALDDSVADTQYARTHSLLALNRFPEARLAFENLRALNPEFPGFSLLLARLLQGEGRHDQAHELLLSLVTGEPDNAGYHYALGVFQASAGDFDKASVSFEETLALDPASTDAMLNLGQIQRERGELVSAQELFRNATVSSQNSARAWTELADIHVRLSQLDQAVSCYRKASELDPTDVDLANNLGVVFGRLGQWQSAVVAFSRSVQLQPEAARGHYNLAQALVQIGDDAKAGPHLSKAIGLGQTVNASLRQRLAPYLEKP